ncbi:capsular biosynthesis protein [Comamonas terrigena]|uniref:capsular biosynthesis protein n=1 Tax=Comamonas terrigena TaxID=32013 RepID=UPI002897BE7B|nr:capsular biosynthesis protein [Comamonas terrigena]
MIVITMAGMSSRFFENGYQIPKYALNLWGKTVFEWAVCSFESYFSEEFFLFVIRPDDFAENFVNEYAAKIGIKKFKIFRLEKDTRGQAETAYISLLSYKEDFSITIFNIDTIRYKYKKPKFLSECDGYLEVFRGDGSHWSFIESGEMQSVIRTTEKDRISDLCSDGLYYFKSQLKFREIFKETLKNNDLTKGEFYIAPLYNRLIESGGVVKYDVIGAEQIDFCGTPFEYEALLKKKASA